METIYNLLKRAEELRRKRETGSITAEDVGGLQYDTLAYVANVEQLQKTLGVRRVYKTIDEMLQNTEPLAENGVPLKFGQLVMVFDEENLDCEENGSIYVYQAPGWKLAARDRRVNSIEGVKAELLARIQGTSEDSNAMTDPFVKLFAGNSTVLAEVLDSTIESGRYRIVYGGFMHVDLNVWARSNGTIVQTIEGFIKNYEGGIDVSVGERNSYTRERVNNVWSKWHPEKSLAGKSIAFFGGSMCHLAVGKGSISQYSDTTKSNTITEKIGYIREQLEYYGANIVNYAVSGSGFLRPIDGKTIFSQASNAGVHDTYVIWASTNDWTMGAYPLGEFDDFQKDGKVETVCGALNATISALIDKNKNAKIYVLLPMKGVDTRGFDFANGKYGNAMSDIISTYYKNPMGYTFGDYINAVVKVCAFRGVAVADTFSTANLSLTQIINSAITGLYWNEGLLVGGSDVYVGYYIHPRRAGYKAVWEVIKRTLIDEYGEHIVQQAAIYSEQERAKKAENTLAEQIAAILKRIAALEGLHVAIEATVADNNLTLSGDGVELETGEAVESYSLALPEDKVTLEDENLIIN